MNMSLETQMSEIEDGEKLETKQRLARLLLPVIVCLPAVLVILYMTRYGIGLTPDSVAYINSAENLAAGNGFRLSYGNPPNQWLTQFPPLYPFLLSAFEVFNIPAVQAAKWLSIILLFTFTILFSVIIRTKRKKFELWQIFFIFAISLSSSILISFSNAWSESLFLVFGFYGWFVFSRKSQADNLSVFFLPGILFAAATLTRFSGIIFILTAISVILTENWDLKDKIKASTAIASPTFLLLISWFAWSFSNTGSPVSRNFAFHLPGITEIKQAIHTFGSWFLIPYSVDLWIKGTILVFLLLTFSLLVIKNFFPGKQGSSSKIHRNVISFAVFFLIWYFLFIVLSFSFLDANIQFDERIFLPAFFMLMVLVAMLIDQYSQSIDRHLWLNYGLSALFILAAGISFWQKIPVIEQGHQIGIGFNRLFWQENITWDILSDFPENMIVVTNTPEPVVLYTNRTVISLPKRYLDMDQRENKGIESELMDLKNKFQTTGAIFLFFPPLQIYTDFSEKEAINFFNLESVFSNQQTHIYQYIP